MYLVINPNGKDGGMWITFITSISRHTAYWPPSKVFTHIDHYTLDKLKDIFPNVRTKTHVEFIHREYRRLIGKAKAMVE